MLALQETKAREDQLPLMGLQALGYDVAVAGTNQWNGVALVSRVGLDDVRVGFDAMPGYGDPIAPEVVSGKGLVSTSEATTPHELRSSGR